MMGEPLAGGQDIVGAHEQHAALDLRLHGQGHVHGHLVAVEVGVVGRADERVQLDGLALNQGGLEGLDARGGEGSGRG